MDRQRKDREKKRRRRRQSRVDRYINEEKKTGERKAGSAIGVGGSQ